jgi:hypothetical protein
VSRGISAATLTREVTNNLERIYLTTFTLNTHNTNSVIRTRPGPAGKSAGGAAILYFLLKYYPVYPRYETDLTAHVAHVSMTPPTTIR